MSFTVYYTVRAYKKIDDLKSICAVDGGHETYERALNAAGMNMDADVVVIEVWLDSKIMNAVFIKG